MNVELHLRNLRESLQVIEESISKGVVDRQRNIGFNTSAANSDMLEILLHKKSLIDPGFVVKHDWFDSKKKVEEKFPFDFPNKKDIFELMFRIESKRNLLCYGKPQKEEVILELLQEFNKLKEKFKEAGLDEL